MRLSKLPNSHPVVTFVTAFGCFAGDHPPASVPVGRLAARFSCARTSQSGDSGRIKHVLREDGEPRLAGAASRIQALPGGNDESKVETVRSSRRCDERGFLVANINAAHAETSIR